MVLDSLTGCQDASRLLVRKAGDGVLETKLTLVDVANSKRFTGYAILNLISQEALKRQGAPHLGKPGLFEDHLSSSGNTLSDDLHHPLICRQDTTIVEVLQVLAHSLHLLPRTAAASETMVRRLGKSSHSKGHHY